jgi:hypothetical protein
VVAVEHRTDVGSLHEHGCAVEDCPAPDVVADQFADQLEEPR